MHKIKIDNLEIFGFHGVYEYEKKKGQTFYVDIEYIPRENITLINDDICEVTDYVKLVSDFTELFNKKRYSLIEVLGREIAEELILIYKSVTNF